MTFKEIFRSELRALFVSRWPAVLLLFGIPLVYAMLFGFAYSGNVVKYVPVVIYDQDQTAVSRSLIQAYIDSEKYEVVAQVTTQEAMEQWLRENKALAAIAIPPKFAQHIKLGLAAEVLLTTNSTNIMFANAAISASQEIVQTFSAATGQKLLEALNQMPDPALRTVAPVKLGVRIFSNPTTSYTNFMLPGLVANGLQIAILLVAGTLLVKEYANLARWQGASSTAIVAGKLLPCWLCAAGSFFAYLAAIILFFGVPYRGGVFLDIVLLGAAFTFLVINLSLFFSAITSSEVIALQMPLLYIMPGLLYSGLSWPVFAMDDFARFFSALMPLTYMADTLRDLLLAGYSADLPQNILTMFAGGGVLNLITVRVFDHRRKKLRFKTMKEAAL